MKHIVETKHMTQRAMRKLTHVRHEAVTISS